ncbi:hypothetical protein COTS27_01665 [Spirochaetota bacterium]|nr:hypothetical protein COTS27_01665 [Spirochaetota bacterium]
MESRQLTVDELAYLSDAVSRPKLIDGEEDFEKTTEVILDPITMPRAPKWWLIVLVGAVSGLLLYGVSVGYLFYEGTGVWGISHPVVWGYAIINLVWWIGIGHAGTLISAILFLARQRWRTSINRFAEAMTIFAVLCAVQFPLLHLGRPWYAYWFFPLPNQMGMWPNFRSPLLWDFFAFSTYFTISLMFWYVGLVPDLAVLRDRAKSKVKAMVYGFFALGWRGANRHWQNYERAYLILAGIATPLVLSVHSVVSFDFAVSQLPGWHTTIFPPYFVAGAIFSGFALVLTLMIIAREVYGFKQMVTIYHIDTMNKFLLATGTMVGYAYTMEFFIAWYSGNEYERFAFVNRAFGPYAWAYWTMFSCNVFVPQIFWFKKMRRHIAVTFVVSILVNIGMWFERFVIIVTSLHRDFLPANWSYYIPTWVDIATYVGTFGLFFTFFLLFLRYLPAIAISEIKGIMNKADPHYKGYTSSASSNR